MSWNKSTNTRHTCNDGDGPYFGRKTAGCPRCDELLSGARPIEGWNARKDREYANFKRALAAHNCQERNCGPVCTAFDW